jgi:hypothetical protein
MQQALGKGSDVNTSLVFAIVSLVVLAALWYLIGRCMAYFRANHEGVAAAAAAIQAVAVVIAGLWFGWVFYYSEKVKPTLAETFLNTQVRLAIAGTETDSEGKEFFVVRLEIEAENKSGQHLDLPSSIVVVNADIVGSNQRPFAAVDLEKSLNGYRGARHRFRGTLEQTKVVYVGNEYSRWSIGVGERVLHSRLFRVPVGQFDQLEVNWYTLAGPGLAGVEVAHLVVPNERNDFIVTSCACKGVCPKPPKLAASSVDGQECAPPWHELESKDAQKMFGFDNKTGLSFATAFLLLPHKTAGAKPASANPTKR